MSTRVRSRRWCFTLNNPTREEEESIQQVMIALRQGRSSDSATTCKFQYLISGKEQVSTPHLQGYVELRSKTSLITMKKWQPRAHWEKAKGTSLEASDYCKKDGDYEEAGELMVQVILNWANNLLRKFELG